MSIVEESFRRLYPQKEFIYTAQLIYSGRFSDYNANVKKRGHNIVFNLSKSWKPVSDEIKIGLIQDLFLRLFKDRIKTTNIDLYNNFVRSIHLSVPKVDIDPVLRASFDRVNAGYFYGGAELPNLVWGNYSKRKLASYNYHTDTISVSRFFMDARPQVIDYLMFHELLHKSLKFRGSGKKTLHHSAAFRKLEGSFEGHDELEKELAAIIRKKSRRSFLEILKNQ